MRYYKNIQPPQPTSYNYYLFIYYYAQGRSLTYELELYIRYFNYYIIYDVFKIINRLLGRVLKFYFIVKQLNPLLEN